MEDNTIAGQVKEFLQREFGNQGVELTDTTNLLNEWFVDSLGIIETVLFIESQFGIRIQRADINGSNFRDIKTLSEFVSRRLTA